MKPLRQYTVNEDVFNTIVKTMSSRIKYTDNLKQYYSGYQNKKTIYYTNCNSGEYIIIQEYLLNHFLSKKEKFKECSNWKQVIVRKIDNQKQEVIQDVTGLYAYNYMMKLLKKYYLNYELESILNSFTNEYNKKYIQFHYNYSNQYKAIVKHENCYKYDINSAYASLLIGIFPKAKKDIEKLYKERKDNPNNKMFLNYFTGYLKHKGYEGIYNYIVQTISKKLQETINYTQGQLIYANTDGFIIKNPKQILKASKELGKFKLEYQGDVYTYSDKNYSCYQFGDEIVGNIRNCVRHLVDLSVGKIVHYDLIRHEVNGVRTVDVENIIGEVI